ncbi:hypothetical protein ACET3Z_016599 [Daucus carota]
MSTSSICTPRRDGTYACQRCSQVFSSLMAVLGHQNAHREGRPAKRRRRAQTHRQNPPGTMMRSSYSSVSPLPSGTPAPPASAFLISFGRVPGNNLVTASLAPPPAPLQTPAIGTPRLFEVPNLLGPSVAPTAPHVGSSSTHPIVLDSEDQEENALDLDLKL